MGHKQSGAKAHGTPGALPILTASRARTRRLLESSAVSAVVRRVRRMPTLERRTAHNGTFSPNNGDGE
jgi:hypothetical protein